MTAIEIQLLLGLLVAIAALALLADKISVPFPILLVVAGTLLGFIPGLPRNKVILSPDLVFVAFLPPLLYHGGFMTTWRDFRANAWPIGLLAVGLVLVTTIVIGYGVYWMIPGMPLAAAFALGAIISSTDAIAATAIAEKLRVPRRVIAILEGESLVNDATALVGYALAVTAASTGTFSLPAASGRFLFLVIGGIAVGLVAGWIIVELQKRVNHSNVEGVVSLLAPSVAYIPAEWLGVSGVLATVTAGIYMARQAPRVLSANSRVRLAIVWDTLVFLLNGAVFILIGLQLPAIVESLSEIHALVLVKYAMVVCLLTITLRLGWVFPLAWIRRKFLRRNVANWGEVTVVSWSGMRGIVTLAAALALPLKLADNSTPFPQRDMIIFLSFAVIFVTLVGQGLTLAPLIRRLGLREDLSAQKEEWEARLDAAHAAVARLQVMALEEGISEECLALVRDEYAERIEQLSTTRRGEMPQADDERSIAVMRIRREALIAERKMITMMRDLNIIGDEVLRRVLRDIDLAEARLAE